MVTDPGQEPFAVGSVIAGRLRIVRRLGIGGMGAVYEVEHEITRHRRALKLLHAQMAELPEVQERFLREASAAGRIGNPHIVETFDAGRLDGGEPYLVMELLRGKTLADALAANGPLDVATACDVLIQTCDGVAAAHAAGIIHRDLKPENLFLVGPDGSYVKILDFGISKFDAAITGVQGFTLEGLPIGTPYYMAPEQVRGQKTVDVSADVYALGVVLYECLTAKRPFDADNLPHLIYLVSQGQYRAASELRPALPRVLDGIVAKAMALEPTERYPSVQELAAALTRLRQSLAPPPIVPQYPPSSLPPSALPSQAAPPARATAPDVGAPGSEMNPGVAPSRAAPALTPGVFLTPTTRQSSTHSSGSASQRRTLWVAALIGLGGAVAAVAIVTYRMKAPAGQRAGDAPSAVISSAVTASIGSGVDAATVASSGVVDFTTAASSSAVASPLEIVPGSTAPSTNVATSHSAEPAASKGPPARPPKAAASAKNRAASVGLSEDNPFK